MISNLRSLPIQGYVTDSAGNILRDARIVIKRLTPTGSKSITSTISGDDGYFITEPMPNGVYEIFESGIRVAKIIHTPCTTSIPCFKADSANYKSGNISNFTSLAQASNLQSFVTYLQIESPDIDVSIYGNSFPVYDNDITINIDQDLYNLSNFHNLTGDSRITTTRFDVEYYSPLTAVSDIYRRIMWSGIPAIRFFEDSKLVIPMDYYSIVPSLPKIVSPEGVDFPSSDVELLSVSTDVLTMSSDNSDFIDLLSLISVGQIVELSITDGATSDTWYGIIDLIGSGSVTMEKWKSSRFTSTTPLSPASYHVTKIKIYDGMFNNLSNIDDGINMYIHVKENNYAQINKSEVFSYPTP